jgi:lipopolysaccharide export system permease protein
LPEARRNAIRANFHFRMVEVAMMLLVPLLAVALAVPPKRSTSGLGIFVAIIFVVVYHKVNQYAEQMGALGRFDPTIALWAPFLLFGGSIVWMYYTLAHKPGGQPIGALERVFARIAKMVGRLLRRRRREPAIAASWSTCNSSPRGGSRFT